ncbi:sensor histidine kinase [Streptomyces sp. 7N604]|uniref:sensor histidine kinase n=1 Tax=Streptomyces sp. 7N604 TaxID=3457415 RepID=UPI003FD33DD1
MTARPFAPPGRPHRDDVLIALAGLAGGLVLWTLGIQTNIPRGQDPGAYPLIPLALMCCAVLMRRNGQPWGLFLASGVLLADQLIGSLIATVLMFTDVIYAAVLYGYQRMSRRIIPVATVITIGLTIWALATYRTPDALMIGVVSALISVAPAWSGLAIREHREAAEAERLRAEQTALLAEMDRSQAVTAERARMARELHDMVANHLSAIAIHSTAAQSIADPKATSEALAVIRENSVQGLAEMRRLIGLLRDAGADGEPAAAPRLDGLDALIAQARTNGAASGLSFALRDGRATGAPALPAPVELAAYRIAQEAVTNALKHATAGEVLVRIGHDSAAPDGTRTHDGTSIHGPLTVRVTSPYGDRPGPRAPGSGAGLVGMRERVALLGGEFEAGPVAVPGDGRVKVWQVRAVLPVEDKSAEGHSA